VHAPLILQVALGVATADIATAYALPSATLAKRLVRAKQRLRADPASFTIPDRVDPARVGALLDAIYAAYSSDWMRAAPVEAAERVADEAVHASQLLLTARPDDLEVRGLAALLLFLRSRQAARIVDGRLVPLEEQDPAAWDATLIARAESLLRTRGFGPGAPLPGPYELQAAIQSAHAARRATGEVDRVAVARLHDALVAISPSRGAAVARAVAIASATTAEVGLRQLDALIADDPGFDAFQPFHAARARLLEDQGDPAAAASLLRAIVLSTHAPSRRHLEARLASLGAG
jgi:RNA polymerase sigma-70 factor (ECF subfamily)